VPDDQEVSEEPDVVDADQDTIEPVRMQALDPEYDRITASGSPTTGPHHVEVTEKKDDHS
jgi:hypothetical protein